MSSKSTEFDVTALATVIALPLIMVAVLPISLWFGWAVSVLWGWFVTPVFGLPQITITQAAGISLVLGLMRARLAQPKDEGGFALKVFTIVVAPPLSVGMGWLLKWMAF